jgi:hypothetical protein
VEDTPADHQTRSALLKFSTGSSREPAAGFPNLLGYNGKEMRFEITEAGQGRMPSSATCFNSLALPLYVDKAELDSKLRVAFLTYNTTAAKRAAKLAFKD